MVVRLDWRLILNDSGTLPQYAVATLDTYFTRFAEPKGSIEGGAWRVDRAHPCLNCGARGCGFTWGIVTGCGHCHQCGWPARRDHDAGIVTFRNVVLQYHPDFVETGKPDPFTGFPYRVIPERQPETTA